MGRPPKFDEAQVLDAAADLVVRDGPAALSVLGVAEKLGAPSGSIYHRFGSRDLLAASLWLRAVERFQAGWCAASRHLDPCMSVRRAAGYVLRWSRANLADAALLLLYRSRDLLHGDWPGELAGRNQAQRGRIERTLGELCERLCARTAIDKRRVVFAVIDIPYGAVRGPLARGVPPETELDALVDDAVVAVIAGIGKRSPP